MELYTKLCKATDSSEAIRKANSDLTWITNAFFSSREWRIIVLCLSFNSPVLTTGAHNSGDCATFVWLFAAVTNTMTKSNTRKKRIYFLSHIARLPRTCELLPE